jgi:hypothetical protein
MTFQLEVMQQFAVETISQIRIQFFSVLPKFEGRSPPFFIRVGKSNIL